MMTTRFAHMINLGKVGGLERLYSQFISCRCPGHPVAHHTVLTREGIAAPIKTLVRGGSQTISSLKRMGTFKIPRWPSALRRVHRSRILGHIDPDIIVLWSNPTAVDLHGLHTHARIFYYEHGASWFDLKFEGLDRQFEKIDGIVCNSLAAKRMIQLKWRIDPAIKITVCHNGVRPDSIPRTVQPKNYPVNRPFRLGIAGRLVPVKGLSLVLHAVRILVARGLPCELHVAGTGREKRHLEKEAARLNLGKSVTFLGFVSDMARFYTTVDCFICPSIREPFGLVCAEALANGCPVIASRVDGLPEVVDHRQTGYCITPTLPIHRYSDFGGNSDAIPRFVYNPETDEVAPPRLLDPEAIAGAVEKLMTDAQTHQQMSQTAICRAHKKFDFSRHVQDVLAAMIQ